MILFEIQIYVRVSWRMISSVLEAELMASHTLGKSSTLELHSYCTSAFYFLVLFLVDYRKGIYLKS